MLFNSITFILFHFFLVLIYWAMPRQSYRQVLLFISSIIFYGWYDWSALIIIGISMVINYLFSRMIGAAESEARAGQILKIAIIVNLCSLGWFKYSEFIADNLVSLLGQIGIVIKNPPVSHWLPLGISFYTFQIIGYLVDVKRGLVKAEPNFLIFGVFKCYYAQLVAGPIVRAHELIPQLKTKQTFNSQDFLLGLFYLIAGLAIKICIADTLAQFVEYGFSDPSQLSTLTAWTTLYGFAFQILSDFWGYSTIAIGLGLMYGIILPLNFDRPYLATSLREFWRRWHITLSVWLRDYIYIPLGGNRGNTGRNLFLTMLLGGIWHGASWNFVFWGAGHGLWLAAERALATRRIGKMAPDHWLATIIKTLLVFHGVCLLWVFFRAKTFAAALAYFSTLFGTSTATDFPSENLLFILLGFVAFTFLLGKAVTDRRFLEWRLWHQVAVCLLLLLLIISYADARLDFIYFVF
jgi:alginate O-acetyltransferase complex protein AlgI